MSHGLPRPRRAAAAARRPPGQARRPGSCASAARTTSAIRRVPLDVAVRDSSRSDRRAAPDGPDPAAHPPAHARPLLQPGRASTTASRRRHARSVVAEVTNTPWGERHAYVLRPRSDGPCSTAPSTSAARLAVHADGPALHLVIAAPGAAPHAVGPHREPRGRRARLRRHAALRARAAHRAARTRPARHPGGDAARARR